LAKAWRRESGILQGLLSEVEGKATNRGIQQAACAAGTLDAW
jgi:hypothetical protein